MPYIMSYECDECGEWFADDNQLYQHEKSHLPYDIQCLGENCTHNFKTYGGMLIHMEFGNCISGANEVGVNAAAARIFQWKKFVDPKLRAQLLRRELPNEQPFHCPGCGKWFWKLSAMIMHVESRRCDCNMGWKIMGQLMRWLENVYG